MPDRRAPKALRPQIDWMLFPTVLAAGVVLSGGRCIAQGQQVAASNSSANAPNEPIAIVPIDTTANVTGASRITLGKAYITSSGTITSGSRSTEVLLPRRGTLRICAATTVNFATDRSVPANDTPGLMMALDRGAVETSFAVGRNSDVLLTPDFRILIGGSGASEVKVRLGEHGDTCVDNPGANAPYVVVSSVFEGGAYRVQPGQRVMFQHGSLNSVVDQEKEPCGCPAEARPNSNDFPLAQSAGLAPLPTPATPVSPVKSSNQKMAQPLVYAPAPNSATTAEPATPAETTGATPPPAPPPAPAPKQTGKHRSLFRGIGRFFRRLFGAD